MESWRVPLGQEKPCLFSVHPLPGSRTRRHRWSLTARPTSPHWWVTTAACRTTRSRPWKKVLSPPQAWHGEGVNSVMEERFFKNQDQIIRFNSELVWVMFMKLTNCTFTKSLHKVKVWRKAYQTSMFCYLKISVM